MRTGPKFEITFEMAVENIRTVAARLQVASLSLRQYREHGSFSADAIARRHGWRNVIQAAGLIHAANGRRRQSRRLCSQECGRVSMTWPRWHLCRTCFRKIERLRGMDEETSCLSL